MHSVIVPVFNGEKHVGDALTSALVELDPDDEIVVIDNGSTDATLGLVAAIADPRIRLFSENRRGTAAARNRGLREARGELISFLDHDDLWPAGRQQGLQRALAAAPEANAAYGRLRVRIDSGRDRGFARLDGRFAPAIGLHAYLFHRSLLDRTGELDETLLIGEDTDYIARLQEAGMRCAIFDGDAAVYRRHDSNLTRETRDAEAGMMQVLVRSIARKRADK